MKKISPTWILFESGNSVTVELGLYSAAENATRPIDAYIVAECEGDFTKAARRAADSVYHIFKDKYDTKPQIVGYDLETGEGHSLTGGSGGLSFAIALAKALYIGEDPGPVAATGEIHTRGEIKSVNGFISKANAAMTILPSGGYFFYPEGNHKEITAAIEKMAKSKNIILLPVSSVSQTLDTLFKWHKPCPTNGPQNSPVPLFACLMALIIILITYLAVSKHNKQPAETAYQSDKINTVLKKIPTPKILTPQNEKRPPAITHQSTATKKISIRKPSMKTVDKKTVPAPTNVDRFVLIDFRGATESEQTMAKMLTKSLQEYMETKGILGAGVSVKGQVKILWEGDYQSKNKQPNRVSLINFSVKKLGIVKKFPNVDEILNKSDNKDTAVTKLLSKIVAISNIEESDGKYWLKAQPFSFSPLK